MNVQLFGIGVTTQIGILAIILAIGLLITGIVLKVKKNKKASLSFISSFLFGVFGTILMFISFYLFTK